MRAAKSGVIVNVTSGGGRFVTPSLSLYQGTKFALEGVSEAAAIELAPFGIKVRIVEPGAVHTDFAGGSSIMTQSETVRDYDELTERVWKKLGDLMSAGSRTIVIAKVIFEAVTNTSDKIRYPAGDDVHQMLSERFAMSDEEYKKHAIEHFDVQL